MISSENAADSKLFRRKFLICIASHPPVGPVARVFLGGGRRYAHVRCQAAVTIQQLAPGSDSVLLDGAPIAAMVREVGRSDAVWGWLVDLLDVTSPAERPALFTAQQHAFRTRAEALEWLGIQGADATAEPIG